MSVISIRKGDGILDKAFILIKYNHEVPLTTVTNELLRRVMMYINMMIGARTSSNYHIEKVVDFVIKIPIYVYTNVEKNSDPINLIDEKVRKVKQFLENFNWNEASKSQLWLVRSLHIMGINISSAFTLSTSTPNLDYNDIIDDPVIVKFPKLEFPIIKRHVFSDNSFITYLSDPYVIDYGSFLNLTTSFNDMGMSYNALHLYEHIMTKGWADLDGKDVKILNGCTMSHALCHVYTVHSTLESAKEHSVAAILWSLMSREKGFWTKHKSILDLEIERTVSETRKERTMANMARSDLHAYDYAYNTDIFEYWSNRPFELLLVGPACMDKLTLNHNAIEEVIQKYPRRKDIVRPPNIKFSRIPIDVLKTKKIQGFKILRMDTDEVKRLILDPPTKINAILGYDCSFSCKFEDLSELNTLLHPLLFDGNLFTEEELKTFITKHIMPISCLSLSSAPLSVKHVTEYIAGGGEEIGENMSEAETDESESDGGDVNSTVNSTVNSDSDSEGVNSTVNSDSDVEGERSRYR